MSKTETAKRLYRVIEDYQGGSFGMSYGAQTAEDWLDIATDWLDADGYFDRDGNPTVDEFKGPWLEVIDEGREQELIDYIAEMWQIDFQEIGEDLQQAYKTYKQEFDPAEGEPVCFCEWLDNEAEELGLTSSTEKY